MDSELKKIEVKTLEELVQLLLDSSIKPKPVVELIDYIWNWRDFISPYLFELENHSFYNGFRIAKEYSESSGFVTKMWVKRLPQDDEWIPPTGIAPNYELT